MKEIRPLRDQVVLKRHEAEAKTPGGIIIPENAKEKIDRGTVEAVGPGAIVDGKRVEPDVKVGDRVVFGRYSGNEVEIGATKLLIVKEGDILAVLDD